MTFMLSCTLADRIAAFGMVATPVVPWSWCKNPSPAPMLAFHGTADRYAPYARGTNFLTKEPLQSLQAWLTRWGERNRCSGGAVTTQPAAGVTLRGYDTCADGTAARLYTMQGASHIWPGGRKLAEFGTGPYSSAINATDEMWTFFQNHPLNRWGVQLPRYVEPYNAVGARNPLNAVRYPSWCPLQCACVTAAEFNR